MVSGDVAMVRKIEIKKVGKIAKLDAGWIEIESSYRSFQRNFPKLR